MASSTRREFMRTLGALGAAAGLGGGATRASPATGTPGPPPFEIPRRPFGKTGVHVSAIGVGGHHLGDLPSVDEAVRLAHEALDAGVRFFDNAWEYHDGRSEEWLGRALAGRRDQVFLMTKVCTPLRERCAPFAADRHLELFKSTKRYDGAAGRAQHGYPPSAELPP